MRIKRQGKNCHLPVPEKFRITVPHLLSILLILSAILPVLFVRAEAAEPPAQAQTGAASLYEEPDPDNLRLLQLRVGVIEMEGVIDAYTLHNITLIPLGALSEAIDMPLIVEADKGLVRGSMYKPEQTFFLDVPNRQVILAGKTYPISLDQVKIYPGDIYIDSNLLSQWLPFKLEVNLYSSFVKIQSEEKLPFEKKIEREKQYARLKARGVLAGPQYPEYFEPYAMWSYPFMTLNLQSTTTYNESTGNTGTAYNYSVQSTGDMFKLESSMYLSGSDTKPFDAFRFTLGKKDPEGRLLGPLKAQEYSFIHVNTPTSNLISRPTLPEAGFSVSSYPLAIQGEFDRHTFRGELPDGWEVELYQNGSLIGYVNKSTEGQYVFENIPLQFGRNHFRLAFYGPQGQEREEFRTFDLSDALVQKGKQYYRVVGATDKDGGYHSGIQYDYGVSNRFTLSAEVQSLMLGKDKQINKPAQQEDFVRVGVRTLSDRLLLSGDVVSTSSGGSLAELGLKSTLGANTQIDLQGTVLKDYVSDTYPELSDPLVNRTYLALTSTLPPIFSASIPVNFGLRSDAHKSGATTNTLSNRLSMTIYRLSISNSLSLVSASSQSDQLTGQLQISRRHQKFNLRGDIGYSVSPQSDISNVALTIDNIRKGKGIYSFGVNQQINPSQTQLSARYYRPVGVFALNSSITYNTSGAHSLALGLTMGIGREPRTPKWLFDAKPIAGTGAVSAKVFIDKNQNGVFDPGEQPIEGVKFTRNGSGLNATTDKNGIAMITNLTSHQPSDIGISMRTLEDPLWSPLIEGVRVTPRPGSVSIVDFPVLETGEIDGTTYLASGSALRPVSDVLMELIDVNGKVIQIQTTAADGFYVFSKVPAGKYLVRVSPKTVSEYLLLEERPLQVTIDENNQFISGINFRLERK